MINISYLVPNIKCAFDEQIKNLNEVIERSNDDPTGFLHKVATENKSMITGIRDRLMNNVSSGHDHVVMLTPEEFDKVCELLAD